MRGAACRHKWRYLLVPQAVGCEVKLHPFCLLQTADFIASSYSKESQAAPAIKYTSSSSECSGAIGDAHDAPGASAPGGGPVCLRVLFKARQAQPAVRQVGGGGFQARQPGERALHRRDAAPPRACHTPAAHPLARRCATCPPRPPPPLAQILNMPELLEECRRWRFTDEATGMTFAAACASWQPGSDLAANIAGGPTAVAGAHASVHNCWPSCAPPSC